MASSICAWKSQSYSSVAAVNRQSSSPLFFEAKQEESSEQAGAETTAEDANANLYAYKGG